MAFSIDLILVYAVLHFASLTRFSIKKSLIKMCFPDKVMSSVLKFAFSSALQFAIKNRFRHRRKEFPKRDHWLDWAKEKYDVSDPHRYSGPRVF